MKMTFRWYGFNDPIKLSQIRQIPNMTGVVTAIYDVPVGELWPVDKVESIQKELKKYRDELKKGDKVMTTGGIFGKIVEINDFTVIIEVESQARLKVSKEAIVKDMTDVPASK